MSISDCRFSLPAPLTVHILHVVLLASNKQVIRPPTERRITLVQHAFSDGDVAVVEAIGESMNRHMTFPVVNLSIPLRVGGSLPEPTSSCRTLRSRLQQFFELIRATWCRCTRARTKSSSVARTSNSKSTGALGAAAVDVATTSLAELRRIAPRWRNGKELSAAYASNTKRSPLTVFRSFRASNFRYMHRAIVAYFEDNSYVSA